MHPSSIELSGRTITISQMQPVGFKEIIQWCIEEGWNMGLHDSDIYYGMDPAGHYVAKTDEQVASLSLIKQSPTFFTIGPFIVHKSHRKQGIGEALWNAALSRMEQEHPEAHIVLYAVLKEVERYKKVGFISAMTTQRWYLDSRPSIIPAFCSQCVAITDALISDVSKYHQTHYVADREQLLKELLLKPETNGLVFIDNNVIRGFGFIRPCVRGFRIGALIADTPDIACTLIAGLRILAQNAPVFMDVPDINPHGMECMKTFHAVRAPQEDTVMMIKGAGYSDYLKQWERHYGLFSLEIG